MKISHTTNPTPSRKTPVASGETISIMVDTVELGRPRLPERPGFIWVLLDDTQPLRPGCTPKMPPEADFEGLLPSDPRLLL